MLYFAYGSNMSKEDLDKWCAGRGCGCQTLRVLNPVPVQLKGYKLDFNFFSVSRGAGSANIMEAPEREVWGLLFEIDEKEQETLRKKEGFPRTYEEKTVSVTNLSGSLIEGVLTYKLAAAKESKQFVRPKKTYLELMLAAAEKYQFPKEYVEFLRSIPTVL